MHTPSNDLLVAEIRAERARQRLTLRDLADRVPMSPSTLQRRLAGGCSLSIPEAERIADALGVPLVTLLARATYPEDREVTAA